MSLSIFKFPKDPIYPYFLELIINSSSVKNKYISNTQGIGNKSLVRIYKNKCDIILHLLLNK
jgi:hypothetical protein